MSNEFLLSNIIPFAGSGLVGYAIGFALKKTSVSTPMEQEPAAANAQPQESQVDPDKVLHQTSHEIRILLSRDSLSEQIARVDSPGIEWVWLSGVMDEKSRILSNVKLERGELLK